MSEQMKDITVCGDCAYYSMKKHKCTRGCTDEGDARARFYVDCPLQDVRSMETVDAAANMLEDALDTFNEIGNGVSDEDVREAISKVFAARDMLTGRKAEAAT